jgi:hypothetical protein
MGMQPTRCMTCQERVVYRRGCCVRCFGRHRTAIAKGKTTWAKLERRGLVLPAQPRGSAWRKPLWAQ